MGRGGGKGGQKDVASSKGGAWPLRRVAGAAAVGVGAWLLCGVAQRVTHVTRAIPHSPTAEYMRELDGFRAQTAELSETVRAHRFLVIGGAGFTGSALVDDLRRRGAAKVRVMGRTLPPAVEYPYDGEAYPLRGVEYVRGDVTDYDSLRRAMRGVSVVLHTAAHYGSPAFGSRGSGLAPERVNVGGMRNVLRAAAEERVGQVVYTCSSDVTFTGETLHNVNETHPFDSIGLPGRDPYATGELAVGDHYSRTKIESERLLLAADGGGGVRTLSLRPNGIYGPGENSAFPRAVFPAYIFRRMPVYFDEEQETDWVCVYNLVFAHILAVHRLATSPDSVAGKAYYITDGELTNNAAYGIFNPAMEAVGGGWWKLFRIPPAALVAVSDGIEAFTEKTGINLFALLGPAALTRKEALKSVTTDTHDISRARALLGYRPLLTTPQCQRHTADEYVARLRAGGADF